MTKERHTGLKLLVLSLGLVLIGGGALLFSGIAVKVKENQAIAEDERPKDCKKEQQISIKNRGKLEDIELEDGRLNLILEREDGTVHAIEIDHCSGEVLVDATVTIIPEATETKP